MRTELKHGVTYLPASGPPFKQDHKTDAELPAFIEGLRAEGATRVCVDGRPREEE